MSGDLTGLCLYIYTIEGGQKSCLFKGNQIKKYFQPTNYSRKTNQDWFKTSLKIVVRTDIEIELWLPKFFVNLTERVNRKTKPQSCLARGSVIIELSQIVIYDIKHWHHQESLMPGIIVIIIFNYNL